jgi:hypothetical protein
MTRIIGVNPPLTPAWTTDIWGKLAYSNVRTFGATYEIRQATPDSYVITPIIFTPTYLLGKEVPVSEMFVKFTLNRTADPDVWLRPSSFFGKYVGIDV